MSRASKTALFRKLLNSLTRRRGHDRESFRRARVSPLALELLEPRTLLSASPQGSEFRVNAFTPSDQAASSVAMDAAGNFVVAWHSDGQDGSSAGIYAQRYNAAGVARGGEFRVNTYTSDNQTNPCVAMDADGDFVVAWISDRQDNSSYGIYAQRYNSVGIAQGSEFRVNTHTSGAQYWPSIAMDVDGDFVIAWQSDRQENLSTEVYAQRYNAAGIAQGSEFRANTYTTENQLSPSVAMDANGNFVVAWESWGQDGSSSGIYAQRYNAAGIAQGTEFQANTYTTSYQSSPSVAMDADGDFLITWHGDSQTSSSDIYARRYNTAGVAQGNEFRVNSYATGVQNIPGATMDADGDFVITWRSNAQDSSSDDGCFAQYYNASGAADGGEFQVNTYTLDHQRYPSVAMDVDGDFVVAWQSSAQDGSGFGVFAQRYVTNPQPSLVAHAGGPYSVIEGGSVTLDATGTIDAQETATTLSFAWDFDNDGQFDDATGAKPTFIVGSLDNTTAGNPLVFHLRVVNSKGEESIDSTTLAITNAAPTAQLSVPTSISEVAPLTISLVGAADPSAADLAAGIRYSIALSTGSLAANYAVASTSASRTFTFSDSGTYTVYGRVFDKDGGTTDYTTSVTVTNVAPTATISGPAAISEGGSTIVSFSGVNDPSSVDLAAGIRYSFALSAAGLAANYASAAAAASQTLTFSDNGNYTVYGRVFDKDGGTTDYTTSVTVTNIAPTATISGPAAISEGWGTTVSFSGVNDPSSADLAAGIRYSFALSAAGLAANYASAAAAASQTFTFSDNGTYTVYGRVFDKDGGTTDYGTTINVTNVAPTAMITSPATISEGWVTTVSFSNVNDPSSADLAAGIRYSFALSTAGLAANYASADTATSQTFTFSDIGNYTVYGRVFDKDGGTTDYTTTVTVISGHPTATFSGPDTISEGSSTSFTLSNLANFPTADVRYSFALSTAELATDHRWASTTPTSQSILFLDSGIYTVYGRVIDKNNGYTDFTTTINVANVAPTAAHFGGNTTVKEGELSSFVLVLVRDASLGDINAGIHCSFALSVAELATDYSLAGTAQSHEFRIGDQGTHTVYARVIDKDNSYTDYSTVITVLNGEPTASISSPVDGYQGVVGQTREFVLTGTDPSPADQAAGFEYTIYWGDGSSRHVFNGPSGTRVSHVFMTAGTFTPNIMTTDKDHGSSQWTVGAPVTITTFAQQGPSTALSATAGNDVVTITQPNAMSLSVKFGAAPARTYTIGAGGSLKLFALEGNDTLTVTGTSRDDVFRLTPDGLWFNGLFITAEGFENINIAGSGGNDTLIGADKANSWLITGNGTGILNGNTRFSTFERLQGGEANDSFFLQKSGSIGGWIAGAGGYDTLDYSQGAGRTVAVNLVTNKWSYAGSVSGLERVVGTGARTTITAANTSNQWDINGFWSGRINTLDFAGVSVLIGGTASDSFRFSGVGSISQIDGKAGFDTLDLSGFVGRVQLDLPTAKATGIASKYLGIEAFAGNGADGTLAGPVAVSKWILTGQNSGSVNGTPFQGFGNLRSNKYNDTVQLLPGSGLSGGLDGGAGTNLLDYGRYGSAVAVNLASGAATGLGAVSNFLMVVGSAFDDLLTANSTGSVLLGGAGSDQLFGGGRRDILVGGSGADRIYGGDGEDILIDALLRYHNEGSGAVDVARLDSVYKSWNSGSAFTSRVSSLSRGSSFLAAASLFANDGAVDELFGEGANDWMITHTDDLTPDLLPGDIRRILA